MKRLRILALAWTLGGGLVGCATAPGSSDTTTPTRPGAPAAAQGPADSGGLPSPGAEPSRAVATVDLAPTLSGRLTLRVHRPADGATEGGSLLFEFEGSPERGSLLLQTAIGTTIAQAKWSPGQAEVLTPQGRRTGERLDDVATLLLGQRLPLSALLRWMQGQPWSEAPSQPRPDGFEQLGWQVSLAAWHERVITARRPSSSERPQDHEILVRVRLDEPPTEARP